MISYYKYTSGTEFTYGSGTPYKGVFNVIGDTAYTGAFYTSTSQKLEPVNNALSKCFLKQIDFNYSATENVESTLSKIDIYPRSILTPELLNNTIDVLNSNNAKLFATSVTINDSYFNQESRDYADISFSTRLTALNTAPVSIKNINISSSIPLVLGVGINDGGLAISDTSQRSSFVLSENLSSFNYYNNFGLIKGQANSSSPHRFFPGIKVPSADIDHRFMHYNKYTGKLYHTASNSRYFIFDIDYTNGLPELSLNDVLNITNLSPYVSRFTVSYGRSFRCSVSIDSGIRYLEIYALNSTLKLGAFLSSTLGFDSNTIDCVYQRFEDDILLVTGAVNGESAIKVYDIEELLNGNISPVSEHILGTSLPTYIEFTDFDSDLAIFKYHGNVNYLDLEKVEIRSLKSPRSILAQYRSLDDANNFSGNLVDDKISGTEFSDININQNNVILIARSSVVDAYIVDIKYITTDIITTITILKDAIVYDTYAPYKYIVPITSLGNQFVDSDTLDVNSIGLAINTRLQQVISDILLLYNNFSGRYNFSNNQTSTNILANTLERINVNDLLIHMNESINTGTLNRVLVSLLDIQFALAREIDKRDV